MLDSLNSLRYLVNETSFIIWPLGPEGYFAFQKLQPGDYEVFTATDDVTTEIPEFVFQSISVEEAGQVYTFEEQFEVVINI